MNWGLNWKIMNGFTDSWDESPTYTRFLSFKDCNHQAAHPFSNTIRYMLLPYTRIWSPHWWILPTDGGTAYEFSPWNLILAIMHSIYFRQIFATFAPTQLDVLSYFKILHRWVGILQTQGQKVQIVPNHWHSSVPSKTSPMPTVCSVLVIHVSDCGALLSKVDYIVYISLE